jgi:hypothetical protein
MKKIFLLSIFVAVAAGGVFAQSGGAESGYTGWVFINGGINLGFSVGRAQSLKDANGMGGIALSFIQTPVSASADIKLPFSMASNTGGEIFMTLGGFFFHSTLKNDKANGIKYSDTGFGIRPAVYVTRLNVFDNLFKNASPDSIQAYLAIPIGYVVQSINGESHDAGSGFHLGLEGGSKFFFMKNLGFYAEVGVNFRWIGGGIGLAVRI